MQQFMPRESRKPKLRPVDAARMRAARLKGASLKELAKRFGVSVTMACYVCNWDRYK